jgi:hypothetical protein
MVAMAVPSVEKQEMNDSAVFGSPSWFRSAFGGGGLQAMFAPNEADATTGAAGLNTGLLLVIAL